MSVVVATYPMNDNAVRNFTFEQFFDIFKTVELDISSFWLINAGFDKNGNKRYAHLVVRACSLRPLFGPHLVSIFEVPELTNDQEEAKPVMRTFWVHSLTDLRRTHFCFQDRLSFERSTYLIPYTDGQLLIRLKSIRAFLRLPIAPENTMVTPSSPRNLSTSTVSREEVDVEDTEEERLAHAVIMQEKSSKMKSLLNHHVQTMISYLNRELHQESKSSIEMVKSYVNHYCTELDNCMNMSKF
jgi:hypothetical protein